MTGAAVAITLIVLAAAGIMFLTVRHRCDCRRSRRYYFFIYHEKGWVMFLWIPFMIPGTISAFFGDDPLHYVTSIINSLLLAYHTRKWWFHEKGKMKKKAAKLAGRVGFNSHGRLVVESN